MAYSVRADIENIFGIENTERYADPNNENVALDITAKIAWALGEGTEEIESRFADIYVLPFVLPYPLTIITLNALIAGIFLFDIRRVVNSSAEDAISSQRRWADRIVIEVLSGQRKLINPTTKDVIEKYAESAPFIVTS